MIDTMELQQFRDLMLATESLDIGGIRDNQLARRVGAFQRRAGFRTTPDLVASLRKDAALRERFVEGLTINVTNFYRNVDQWIRIRDEVLPELDRPAPSMWSAGCSTGAEAYTMAMVAMDAGLMPTILATDIDRGALAMASSGTYPIDSLREVPEDEIQRHFAVTGDTVAIQPGFETMIEFRRHDLLSDPLPNRQFDFIACRNVAIYFSEEAKRNLHSRLAEATSPGGILFVGGAERISHPRDIGLEMVRPQLYMRSAA